MTLTLNTRIPSLAELVVCIYLSGHRLHNFLKNPLFSLFPIEKPQLQNLTLRKIRQGQPRVIIWTDYDGLKSLMLHTKPIYGRCDHLGHATQMPRRNFCSPYPWWHHIEFGFDWLRGFGEDLWNCGRTDGRQSMGILWAHLWAFGLGDLIKKTPFDYMTGYFCRSVYIDENVNYDVDVSETQYSAYAWIRLSLISLAH